MPRRLTAAICGPVLVLVAATSTIVAGSDSPKRAYHLDVDLDAEDIRDLAFSPDGDALAFTRVRPTRTVSARVFNNLTVDSVRADVWVQSGAGQSLRNLTHGATDGSGWWSPRWSPDGQRLAMLSSRGGNVNLWIWDRTSGQLRQVTTAGVDFDERYEWVDRDRLLCVLVPEGMTSPPSSLSGKTASFATEGWTQLSRGESTASVVDSLSFQYPVRRLFLIDARAPISRNRVVAATTTSDGRSNGSWWTSPTGQVVAVVSAEPTRYGTASLIPLGFPRTVDLKALDGTPVRLDRALPRNVLTTTLRWSVDGQELGFFAYGEAPINAAVLYGLQAARAMPEFQATPRLSLQNPARLYRVHVGHGTVEQVSTGDIEIGALGAPGFRWTPTGEMVFHAPRVQDGPVPVGSQTRAGTIPQQSALGPVPVQYWWMLDRAGRSRPLVTEGHVPADLQTADEGATFVGVSDGDVWRIDVESTTSRNLTSDFAPTITSLRFLHRTRGRRLRGVVQVTMAPDSDGRADVQEYFLDLQSGELAPIRKPAPTVSLVAVAATTGSAVHQMSDLNGLVFWRTDPIGKYSLLLETNTYKRDIRTGERRTIDFTSAQGEALRAVLLLPHDYVAGRRYPLVVFVRSGFSEGHVRTFAGPVALATEFDGYGELGYALLIPATPGNQPGLFQEEGHSLFHVSSAVLPAVDKVVAMGIADPDRLLLTGTSLGGWTVGALLAQTVRFKAAVSVAGVFADASTFSVQGSLPRAMFLRYSDNPARWVSPTPIARSYHPTSLPWWLDLDRPRRNGPFYWAERIQTPLLLVHGDLDANVSMDQSEDMFNALVSMRKRAQLVRYWGEDHSIATPANRRDLWQRTFAWFDEFADITRNADGHLVFEGDRVKSRGGRPPLPPEAFARFGPASVSQPVSSSTSAADAAAIKR